MPVFDMTYILLVMLPTMGLAMLASFLTKSTFSKYSRIRSKKGYTGAEAARIMLERHGVYDCRIE